jgi:hypothetical protein
MSSSNELPKMACPKCGKVFKGISKDSVEKKHKDHVDSCDVDRQSDDPHINKEDAKYSTSVSPPRDLEQYDMTEHFHSMLTRRENPEPTTEIIKKTVETGFIKSTHKSGNFIFEKMIDGWTWWVVIHMRDEALIYPDENHLAITIYSPDSDSHEEVNKYV